MRRTDAHDSSRTLRAIASRMKPPTSAVIETESPTPTSPQQRRQEGDQTDPQHDLDRVTQLSSLVRPAPLMASTLVPRAVPRAKARPRHQHQAGTPPLLAEHDDDQRLPDGQQHARDGRGHHHDQPRACR